MQSRLLLSIRSISSISTPKNPLPILICGRNPRVASAVSAALRPDYDVIHSISSPQAGTLDIPAFLRGDGNTASTSSQGTTAPTPTPVAILVGGGYTVHDMEMMREACRGLDPVIWLKVKKDMSGPLPPLEEYGAEVGRRAREYLNGVRDRGELGGGGVYYI